MWISCLLHVNSFELPPGFIGIQAVERASHHCTQESEARIDQAACKPGSVHRRLRMETSGWATIPLGRPSRTASRDQPGRSAMARLSRPSPERPSLFGLAPGGACHAVPVSRNAVRSYRTLSPLPPGEPGSAVCFLWRYPSARSEDLTGRALPAALPSWSPDFPPAHHPERMACQRSPGRLIDL